MRRPRIRPLALGVALLATGCAPSPEDVPRGPTTVSSPEAPAPSSARTPDPFPVASPGPSRATASASGTTAAPPAPSRSSAEGQYLDDPASLAVVVNKRRPLRPVRWAPADLEEVEGQRLRPEAARAVRDLLAAARADGAGTVLLSGYRPYDEQAATYAGWVARLGQAAADTASARPGHSEHQTGLAVDVGEGGACDLQPCFAGTGTAAWVAEHAAEHGFVVRYPRGEQATTGYWYEPWHLRYLGRDRARELVRSGAATLEEFSGLGPAPDYAAEPPRPG